MRMSRFGFAAVALVTVACGGAGSRSVTGRAPQPVSSAGAQLVPQIPGIALTSDAGLVESRDGNHVVVSFIEGVGIVDARTGDVVGVRNDLCAEAGSFSPSGSSVALECRKRRVIWDLEKDTLRETPSTGVTPGTVWIDDTSLAGTIDGLGLCRFDTSGAVAWCIGGEGRQPRGMTRTGRVASSDETALSLHDAASGKVVTSLSGKVVAYDGASSRVALRRGDQTAIFDVETQRELAPLGRSEDDVRFRGNHVAWHDASEPLELRVMDLSSMTVTTRPVMPQGVVGDSRARGFVATWDLSSSGTFVSLENQGTSIAVSRVPAVQGSSAPIALAAPVVDIWLSRDGARVLTTPFSVIDLIKRTVAGPPNPHRYPLLDRGVATPALAWVGAHQLVAADRRKVCTYDLRVPTVACREVAAAGSPSGEATMGALLLSADGQSLLAVEEGEGLAMVSMATGATRRWPGCNVGAWGVAGEIAMACGNSAQVVDVASGKVRFRWEAPRDIRQIGVAPSGELIVVVDRMAGEAADGASVFLVSRRGAFAVRRIELASSVDMGAIRANAGASWFLGAGVLQSSTGASFSEVAGATPDLTLWSADDLVSVAGHHEPVAYLARGSRWPWKPPTVAFRDRCVVARARSAREVQLYRLPGHLSGGTSGLQLEPLAVGVTGEGQAAYAMDATHFMGTPGRFARARTGTIARGSVGGVEGSPPLRDDKLLARALSPCTPE